MEQAQCCVEVADLKAKEQQMKKDKSKDRVQDTQVKAATNEKREKSNLKKQKGKAYVSGATHAKYKT